MIQPTDKFADETFNAVINDIDDKVVGIAHLDSSGHWSTWEKNKGYDVNDIIRISDTKSNQYYQCVSKGTSGAKEPTNNVTGSIVVDGTVKWVVMAIGCGGSSSSVDLWSSDSYYSKGTIALYNNKLYRCKIAHTSLATFKDDAPYWQEIKASNTMWATGVYYLADDVIVKDNKLYKCNTSHTSTTFDADKANWKLLGDFSLVNPFAISTEYEEGQFVTYNGILYRCNTKHTSSSVDFATDLANWDVVYANTVDWDINTYYPKETIVLHDKLYYQCLTTHTSSADFEADRAKWQLLSNVPANIQNWEISKYYYTGQCVLVDGIIYRCKTAHTSAATKFDADSANWEQIGGVGGAAIWQASKPYSEGQLIIKDNIIYRCNTKHTSSTDFKNDITNWDIVNANIVDWKVSTYYPKDTIVQHDNLFFKNTVAGVSDSADFENDRANWILMSNVPANLQAWQANKYYYAGQSILKDKNIYVCTKSHLSDTTFNLDLPNWTATGSSTLNEWATKTTYTVGDVVVYNDILYRCNTSHTSGTDFTTNSSYFTELGGNGGSGSGSSYKQITKMDITSPKEILIQVGSTVTFNLPPVEILKFKNVETQQTITECAFDNGDADDFTYDTKYVTFDGVMKENTEYTFNGTTTSLSGGYLTTTDEYIDFSTFKSIEKIDTSDATKTVITAIPQDQVIVSKGLLPLTGIKSLDSVKLKNTTTGSAVIKVAVTNNLKDYYTYNAGTFSAIDITNKSDFLTNGILPTTLESITDSEWKSFGTDIGFAYILSQTVSTESCYIDSLEMLMTLSGSWWKAIHGTDYDYGYISNNTLEVDLLKDGSYKINYAKSAGNGTDEDWATKLEAMSYALSL